MTDQAGVDELPDDTIVCLNEDFKGSLMKVNGWWPATDELGESATSDDNLWEQFPGATVEALPLPAPLSSDEALRVWA